MDITSDDMAKRVAALESWRTRDEPVISRHDGLIERLNDDIRDIRVRLASLATSDQMSDLHAHVDASINGLLREALNATPQWYALLMTAVMSVAGIASAIAAYLAFHK